MRSFASDYDRDLWILYMYMDGVCYRFNGPSPWHNDEFRKRAKKKWNTGIKWIEKIFGKGKLVMKYIIVHNGRAHRDELYAVGLANMVYADKSLPVLRVFRRDPTEEELADPEVIVLDVGRQCDPERRNFDHHQYDDGRLECAFSLLAAHTHVPDYPNLTFAQLWKDAPWYNAVRIQDCVGPSGLAKHFGLGEFLPQEFISGVETFVLQEFGSGDEVSPEWVEFATKMVRTKTRTAIEFMKQMDEIEKHHQLIPILWAENAFDRGHIFWAPDLSPFGINAFIKREAEKGSLFYNDVVITVTKNERSGGLCLFRIDRGDVMFDFTRIKEEPEVTFAHKSGHMAIIKPDLDTDVVMSLIRKAVTRVKTPRAIIEDLRSEGFRTELVDKRTDRRN